MRETRKLAVIFYADVAGYSRLTGIDEEGTHRRVRAVLDAATEKIRSADGMVLRYAGDAILAVFPSVVRAVDSAIAIQTEIAESNAGFAEDQRIEIRIGINLGDVIEDRGEVYGDGMNIAARLESLAPPGGICLSNQAAEQTAGKIDAAFANAGSHELKKISGHPNRAGRIGHRARHLEYGQTISPYVDWRRWWDAAAAGGGPG